MTDLCKRHIEAARALPKTGSLIAGDLSTTGFSVAASAMGGFSLD